MKKIITFINFMLIFSFLNSQINVDYQINTNQEREQISPYIYGVNFAVKANITARRIGGNRLTGFNWENNASNAGEDWYHSSDNYIPSILGVPSYNYDIAGISLRVFHDSSLIYNNYSLMTLQMAGFAAKDKNGTVEEWETAPSPRWVEVVNRKGSTYLLTPDTTDNVLYIDEMLNFLITTYGNANTYTGIKGFILDNEPALWTHTHPRLHPDTLTVAELMTRSIDLATTIKEMDSFAEVFGPDLYGFSAFLDLQGAPDWSNYSGTYSRFIEAYLDLMYLASDSVGYRLLDVLDVHWYPEPAGVYSGDTSQNVSMTRIQLPRSLWDSTYIEDSWIGQYFSPVSLIHYLKDAIDLYYPDTKLSITEYDYGAANHISGGIAQVEALGVFGKFGVYFASKWGSNEQYISTAFNIFRDYDGNSNTFGSTKVFSTMNDTLNTSIYTSIDDSDSTQLHIILVNKNYDSIVNGSFQITSNLQYILAEIWYFDRNDTLINNTTGFSISNNEFDFDLSPLSVYHIVLKTEDSNVEEDLGNNNNNFKFYFNILTNEINIDFINTINSEVFISIYDISGKKIKDINIIPFNNNININVNDILSGIYFLHVKTKEDIFSKKFFLIN